MSPESIPVQVVRTALRSNLPFFGIATIVLTAGISSLLLATLRSRDRLLLWLGIFSILYGSRLFIQNDLIHVAFGADDVWFSRWALCFTYVIPIPYALFARELLGSGWKNSLTLWVWVQLGFLTAIPIALLTRQLYWTDLINGIFVMGGTLLLLLHVILLRRTVRSKGLTWPLIIFATIVLLANQGIRPAGIDLEPFGFLLLLVALGFTAARNVVARERKLVEVEQELATARRIQNSIIPDSAPELARVRVAARYQPMTSVAGDFYDFLGISENSLTILVADVSGHGVPAALVASMLKVCFAAQREHAHDPAAILAGLNSMLRGSLGGQYVTAACAAIDLSANNITYAGAGHPPSLLVRKNSGHVVELAENGLFIGPFPQATYSNISVPFESGDKLLLYTDGIVEATGPDGQEFGRERIIDLLVQTKDVEPSEFIQLLFQKISTPTQQDDLTVVVAQFHSTAPLSSIGTHGARSQLI
ncbi:MAG TPA: PP2C family protein-serine/threonine phosphatase [Bryobacteraceae bacterium]|nr:PP2C family protein-serine/threonine phosphatase [Bryobacteraceae bacterium]